jgi:hypothetical protein
MPDATLALVVAEPGHVEVARRAAAAQAQRIGFDESGVANVSEVVGRLASGLIENSVGGQLLVTSLSMGDVAGLELIALGGSGGHVETLAAIAALVGDCDSYSALDQPPAMMARLWTRPPPVDGFPLAYEFGAISVPAPGELKCGDGWWAESTASRALIVLADGLGHGPVAHEAAQKAMAISRAYRDHTPRDLMVRIHEGLRQTRGAAAIVVVIDLARQTLTCCGVGNIAGMIVTPSHVSGLVSQHGTAGINKVRLQEFSYPFPADAVLILHSDGLKTAWNLDRYPGLAGHQPALVAAMLYRDFVRGRDDTTVVVLRNRQRSPVRTGGDA